MSETKGAQASCSGPCERCHDGAETVSGAEVLPEPGPVERLLAPRELQVARLAAAGFDSSAIAERLAIKPATVRTTLHRVYGKLSIRSRDELRDILASRSEAADGDRGASRNGRDAADNDGCGAMDCSTAAGPPSDAIPMPLLVASVGLLCFVPAAVALQPSLLAYALPTPDAYGACGIGAGAGALAYLLIACPRRRLDMPKPRWLGLSLLIVAAVLLVQLLCMQGGVLTRVDKASDAAACFVAASWEALLCYGLAALFGTSKTLLESAGVLSARLRVEAAAVAVLLVAAASVLNLAQVVIGACGIGIVLCGSVLRWRGCARTPLEFGAPKEPDESSGRLLSPFTRVDSALLGFQALPCCLAFLVVYLFGLSGGFGQLLVWVPFVVFAAAGFHSLRSHLELRPHEVASCALLLALGLMIPGAHALTVCVAAALMGAYLYRSAVRLLVRDRLLPDSTVALWYVPLSIGCLLGGIASVCVARMLAVQRAGDIALASATQPLYELCLFAAASVCAACGLLFWRSCRAARADRAVHARFCGASSDGDLERFRWYLQFKGLDKTCRLVAVATVQGQTVRQIAEELSYAPSTIKALRRRAFRLLDVDDAAGLLQLYRQVIEV